MKVHQATVGPTESDLEANLTGAIARAFPWLDRKELKHQLTFTITAGHTQITVGGEVRTSLSPRLDVLVSYRGKPLAVFELKRAGLELTADDEEQGLSYARLLRPAPPLVVITNGAETRFLDAYTGERWAPASPNEDALQSLIANSGKLAEENLRSAVDCLMGSDPQTWMSIVRQASAAAIQELSGDWDSLLPYTPELSLPRRATAVIEHHLARGERIVVLEGQPLVGKSNVLRELVERTSDKADYAVLYLDASRGLALHHVVADLLGDRFGWPITPQEARHWLKTLSRAGGPALILAVDGFTGDNATLRELESLSKGAYGEALRLVVAMDDTVRTRLAGVGRAPASALLRKYRRITLGELDDEELAAAHHLLHEMRMHLPPAAKFSSDLRRPWALRAACAVIATADMYADTTAMGALPPFLGLDLIEHARHRFDAVEAPFCHFRTLAELLLAEMAGGQRSIDEQAEAMVSYALRRAPVDARLGETTVNALIDAALLKPSRSASGQLTYVVRLPELLASELASLLSFGLVERLPTNEQDLTDTAEAAAAWLADITQRLPLGEIIFAQAFLDAGGRNASLPLDMIATILEAEPHLETVRPGSRSKMIVEDAVFDVTFREGGAMDLAYGGERMRVEADPDEPGVQLVADQFGWLALSHVAGRPFAIIRHGDDDAELGEERGDPSLLMELCAAKVALRRPGEGGVPMHQLPNDLQIVCQDAGIVEPVTLSLFRYLAGAAPDDRQAWVAEALRRDIVPLLARLNTALREMRGSKDHDLSAWAEATLRDLVVPALRAGAGRSLVHA